MDLTARSPISARVARWASMFGEYIYIGLRICCFCCFLFFGNPHTHARTHTTHAQAACTHTHRQAHTRKHTHTCKHTRASTHVQAACTHTQAACTHTSRMHTHTQAHEHTRTRKPHAHTRLVWLDFATIDPKQNLWLPKSWLPS